MNIREDIIHAIRYGGALNPCEPIVLEPWPTVPGFDHVNNAASRIVYLRIGFVKFVSVRMHASKSSLIALYAFGRDLTAANFYIRRRCVVRVRNWRIYA